MAKKQRADNKDYDYRDHNQDAIRDFFNSIRQFMPPPVCSYACLKAERINHRMRGSLYLSGQKT